MNEAERAALEEAGRRQEYETGAAGMYARQALRDESIRAHVDYVQSGRPKRGAERPVDQPFDPNLRSKAVNVDLSIWCDSDREQHQILMEVLTDRDRSDGRNPNLRRDDWIQRIPDVNRKWEITDGLARGEANMMPAQFPSLVLKSVQWNELRPSRREAIENRMQETLQRVFPEDKKVTADYAKVHVVTNAMIRGIPQENDLTQSGRPKMPGGNDPWQQVERYLNVPRGQVPPKEYKARQAMLKGFVNPRVEAHLKPKITNILAADPGLGARDFREPRVGVAALAFPDGQSEFAVLKDMAQRNVFGSQFYDVRQTVSDRVEGEHAQTEILSRRVGEIALDRSLDPEVRESARWAATGVVMKERAGFIEAIGPDHPKRDALTLSADDPREVLRSRDLVIDRGAVVAGLEKLIKGEGTSQASIDEETGKTLVQRTNPKPGDMTADGPFIDGSRVRSVSGLQARPRRSVSAEQRNWDQGPETGGPSVGGR